MCLQLPQRTPADATTPDFDQRPTGTPGTMTSNYTTCLIVLLAGSFMLAAAQPEPSITPPLAQGLEPLPAAVTEKPVMVSETGPDAGVGPVKVSRRGGAASSGSGTRVQPFSLGSNVFQWAWSGETTNTRAAGSWASASRDCLTGRQLVSCFCRSSNSLVVVNEWIPTPARSSAAPTGCTCWYYWTAAATSTISVQVLCS